MIVPAGRIHVDAPDAGMFFIVEPDAATAAFQGSGPGFRQFPYRPVEIHGEDITPGHDLEDGVVIDGGRFHDVKGTGC